MSLQSRWLVGREELRWPDFQATALILQLQGKGIACVYGSGKGSDFVGLMEKLLSENKVEFLPGMEYKFVCPRAMERDLCGELARKNMKNKGKVYQPTEKIELWLRAEDTAVKVRVEAKAVEAEAYIPGRKLKVMVVDDSSTIRKIMKKILAEHPGVAAVEDVGDPVEAEEKIKKFKPDLMTLDINMPKMNGDELLRRLGGSSFKVPTLILTSLNINESRSVMDCLEMGAFDYLHKPESGQMDGFKEELGLRIDLIRQRKTMPKQPSRKVSVRNASQPLQGSYDPKRLFVLGASTGGTEAIKNVLIHMPANISPTLIVQHIPPYFSKAFADRLNDLCAFEVKEAEDGDELRQNRVLVAPGDHQMKLVKRGVSWFVELNKDPLMSGHRPSVDYMFKSVANANHPDVVAVLLTGMGKDGAEGMKILRDKGFPTIAQDEATSVVYGMPKAAAMNGGAAKILGLDVIPDELMVELSKSRKAA